MFVDFILIKTDLAGDFEENNWYKIKFDYAKCHLISLDPNWEDVDVFLKEIDGESILAQYRGFTRLDKKSIFLIDLKQSRRDDIITKLKI